MLQIISITGWFESASVVFDSTTLINANSNGFAYDIFITKLDPLCVAPLLTFLVTPPLCYGDSSGSTTIIAAGGIPPYTYLWSNNDTTATITGIGAGIYTVTVTGNIACPASTATITVTQPPQLTITISSAATD